MPDAALMFAKGQALGLGLTLGIVEAEFDGFGGRGPDGEVDPAVDDGGTVMGGIARFEAGEGTGHGGSR